MRSAEGAAAVAVVVREEEEEAGLAGAEGAVKVGAAWVAAAGVATVAPGRGAWGRRKGGEKGKKCIHEWVYMYACNGR